ncbi:hypothetical protein [Rhizobium mongolense]|uniref:hypothetical protein n=1 Tax=Rhizobium mongolense TaxID=57676 RepID=UPI0034A4F3F6
MSTGIYFHYRGSCVWGCQLTGAALRRYSVSNKSLVSQEILSSLDAAGGCHGPKVDFFIGNQCMAMGFKRIWKLRRALTAPG